MPFIDVWDGHEMAARAALGHKQERDAMLLAIARSASAMLARMEAEPENAFGISVEPDMRDLRQKLAEYEDKHGPL